MEPNSNNSNENSIKKNKEVEENDKNIKDDVNISIKEKKDLEIPNENQKNIFAYKKITPLEIKTHFELIRLWISQYNSFEYVNQSLGKFTKYIKKLDDIKIVMNHKLNFCRIKLYIDFIQLKMHCPNFAEEFKLNFVEYISYINLLSRMILMKSKKILNNTSVFNDLILFNYPYSLEFRKDFKFIYESKTANTNNILSFTKCYVIQVNQPIYLLWCKKEYPTCICKQNSKINNKKYFNFFIQNLKYNVNFSKPSICNKCKKPYFHDTKDDIYIQCQEIKLVVDSKNMLFPNVISVYSFGDLINSVNEGNCITLNAYHISEDINVYEKNYNHGYFIALNFDRYFNSLILLKPIDFKINLQNNDDLIKTFSKLNINQEDEEMRLKDILKSFCFQKQTVENFYKFILYNYIDHKQKELNHIKISDTTDIQLKYPFINEIYFPFINLTLDISIVQRDYYNHNLKLSFFESCLEEKEMKKNKAEEILNDDFNENLRDLTQSNNIIFKNNKNNNKSNCDLNKTQLTTTTFVKSNLDVDIKNYFRLSHQINSLDSISTGLLMKPINLFLIFDNTKNEPLFNNIVLKYATNFYSNLIEIYPTNNQNKWNQNELINYYYINNNKIILIQDIEKLSKIEIEVINLIMNYSMSNNQFNDSKKINITFWFCCNCSLLNDANNQLINNKKNKEGQYTITNNIINENGINIKNFKDALNKCDIVINYSKRNLKNQFDLNIINENSFINFLDDSNNNSLDENKILEMYNYSEYIFNILNNKCTSSHYMENYDNTPSEAIRLIEKFFIEKRSVTNINLEDLFILLRLSIFFAMLRSHYENKKILIPITLNNITFLDALLSILIYEHITYYKYDVKNKVLGGCTYDLLFQDYGQIVNTIINNIVIEEKNNHLNQKLKNFNVQSSQQIPSKSFHTRRHRINENESEQENFFDPFMNNIIDTTSIKNKVHCQICEQIEKLNVEPKENLINFITKLSSFIFKEKNNDCSETQFN